MGSIFTIGAMGSIFSTAVAMMSFYMMMVQAQNSMLLKAGRMIDEAAKG